MMVKMEEKGYFLDWKATWHIRQAQAPAYTTRVICGNTCPAAQHPRMFTQVRRPSRIQRGVALHFPHECDVEWKRKAGNDTPSHSLVYFSLFPFSSCA